ncbi:hypothetical protein TcBrA4_0095190 [Trypanosoma cruzi]|nr:hypothetical protein TcBrA4_0095190 [Trypanosoma cruzi]
MSQTNTHACQLNPHARVWTPKNHDALAAFSNEDAAALPSAPEAMRHLGRIGAANEGRPMADVPLFAAAAALGDFSHFCMQYSLMMARQSYYNFWCHWQMQNYGQCVADYEDDGDYMSPPTVAAFCDAPLSRELPTDTHTNSEVAIDNLQNNPCNDAASVQKTKNHHFSSSPFLPFSHPPHFFDSFLAPNMGEIDTMNSWQRGTSPSCYSSCLLCGKDDHCYSACQLFDGKTVCFIDNSDFAVYAMRHDHWIESATISDVYLFVRLAVGIFPHHALLHVGSKEIILEDYPLETLCCDLRIFPGVVVSVSVRQPSFETNVAPLRFHNTRIAAKRERGRPENTCDVEETMGDAALDASTIARTSELSVSLPLFEPHADVGDHAVAESINGTSTDFIEGENTSLSKGGDTAVSFPKEPRHDGNDLGNPRTPMAKQEVSTVVSTVSVTAVAKSSSCCFSTSDASETSGNHLNCVDIVRKDDNRCNEHPLAATSAEVTTMKQFSDATVTHATIPTSPGKLAPMDEVLDDEKLRLRRTVHVRFIPVHMPFAEIRMLLWSCGEVHKVRLVKPSETTNPRRMFYVCFVEYATDEGAERMKKLQGHRLGEFFHLAVEDSRHTIHGGYFTDFEAHTGRPCTFGLREAERRAVERRYFGVCEGGSDAACKGGGRPKSDAPKSTCWRRGKERSAKACLDAPVGPATMNTADTQETGSDKGEGKAKREKCVGETGPYSLRIVSACGLVGRLRRGGRRRRDAVAGVGGEAAAVPAALSDVLGRVVDMSDEKFLQDCLHDFASRYLQQLTPRSVFEFLVLLEGCKYRSATPTFFLFLARYEVALLLHYAPFRTLEGVAVTAARAIHWGNDFTQVLKDGAKNGARIAPIWHSLFTSIPPARQPFRVPRYDDQKGNELPGSRGELRLYPCCGKVLRFVELLLHISLLLDDFQSNTPQRNGGVETDPAVLLAAPSAKWNDVTHVAQKMLSCARCLLSQLLAEIVSEGDDLSSELPVWRRKVSQILKLLPPESGLSTGSLVSAILPGRKQIAVAVLASEKELFNF